MKTKLTLLLTVAVASHALAQTTAPTAPDARFKQLDKNGDGKLSPEELNMPNIFSRLDKDKDGFVSAAEMTEYFSKRTAKTAPAPAGTVDPNIKPRAHGNEATAAALKPDVLSKLDIAMQQAVANKEVSGVIGLIHHNGKRGYFEAFGMQDIEAATAMAKDSIFRLQSMSKPVVTVAALTLLDEGKFTLDEPISKHLPEWAEPEVLENGQLVPAKFAITLRMLMSHSSGLYYSDIEKGAFSGGATSRDDKTTLAAHSKSLAAKPLKFHPGESYAYGTFKALANESAGIASGRGVAGGGGGGGAAGASGSQFKQRDKNNDGKLSRDELPVALFDRLDVNKDGFVTEEEAKALPKPQP